MPEPGAGERACLRAGESHKGPICVAGFLQCFQTQPSHVFITATPPPPASCQQHRAQLHPLPAALGAHGLHQAPPCCPAVRVGRASSSAVRVLTRGALLPSLSGLRGRAGIGVLTSHCALAACSPPICGVAPCPLVALGQGGRLSGTQISQDVALPASLPASPRRRVPPWFVGGQQSMQRSGECPCLSSCLQCCSGALCEMLLLCCVELQHHGSAPAPLPHCTPWRTLCRLPAAPCLLWRKMSNFS